MGTAALPRCALVFQTLSVLQQRDSTLRRDEFVDETMFELVERCASTHWLTL